MLSPDVLYLIATEQHNDRLRDIAHQQLLAAAELNTPGWQTHRKLAYRMGCLLRQWGARLENYGNPTPSSKAMSLKM